MGDMADWVTDEGFSSLAAHKRGECDGPCPYCEEDEMSLVASYAYCKDGKFYREPVWRGDTFFLCLDDDDPPELVIMKPKALTVEDAKKMATNILTVLGIKAKIIEGSYFGGASRIFKKGSFKFIKAFRYFLEIVEPPPPPNEWEKTPTTDVSKVDGCIYHFGAEIPGLVISRPSRR